MPNKQKRRRTGKSHTCTEIGQKIGELGSRAVYCIEEKEAEVVRAKKGEKGMMGRRKGKIGRKGWVVNLLRAIFLLGKNESPSGFSF